MELPDIRWIMSVTFMRTTNMYARGVGGWVESQLLILFLLRAKKQSLPRENLEKPQTAPG